jgi:DNA-binding transcriptional LysR family regulator
MKIDNNLDWDKLRLFVDIVDSKSMAEAATRNRMTRANISRQLKLIEASLSTELMRRTTRQRELTQAGTILYQHTRRMMQEADSARTAIESLGRSIRGDVRIRLPTGLGHLYLTPLLLEFIKSHPDISLRVAINDHIGDLIAAEIDVALKITSNPPHEHLISKVCSVHWCLCASPDYFKTIRQIKTPIGLREQAWVCPASLGRTFDLKLTKADAVEIVRVSPRLQSGDYPFLVESVETGMGVALLPRYAVWKQLKKNSLIEVLPDYKPEGVGDTLCVLASNGRYPSHAAQVLVEFITHHLLQQRHQWEP